MSKGSVAPPTPRPEAPLTLADVTLVPVCPDGSAGLAVSGEQLAKLVTIDREAFNNLLDDPEEISRDIRNVGCLLSALAAARTEDAEAISGALFVAERCLARLADRVDLLRPGGPDLGGRYRIDRKAVA